jgi:hypothetical protein
LAFLTQFYPIRGRFVHTSRLRFPTLKQHTGEVVMPMLFWFPMILMAGMYDLASDKKKSAPRQPQSQPQQDVFGFAPR